MIMDEFSAGWDIIWNTSTAEHCYHYNQSRKELDRYFGFNERVQLLLCIWVVHNLYTSLFLFWGFVAEHAGSDGNASN